MSEGLSVRFLGIMKHNAYLVGKSFAGMATTARTLRCCLSLFLMLPMVVCAQFTFTTNNGATTITEYTASSCGLCLGNRVLWPFKPASLKFDSETHVNTTTLFRTKDI